MRSLLILIGILIPSTAFAQIVISEVMWAGSEVSSADEWLEIANISGEEINLSGWSITKRASDGGNTEMISFPEDAVIGVGEFYLIANYDSDNSALEVSPDLITTSVSLSNTKLFLQIKDIEGQVIDAVDDGSGSPFAGGKNPYLSMERIDLFSSGEDSNNWKSAEEFGTPGREESEECEDCEESEESSLSSFSSSSSFSSPSLIRITEVLLDTKKSEDYEWIELGNLGEESVDITGWIISDGSRSYTVEPRSEDGYILQAGEHTIFFHYQTGIALASAGEVVTLSNSTGEIDRIDVSETGEEVSFGREPDGSRGPYCVPTPREENAEKKLNPQIEIQSGRSTDYTKVTLNLKTFVDKGSLKSAECFWDFADGTSSKKCNPPSRSWDNVGVYDVKLRVTTVCGDEIIRKKDVVVLQKKSKTSAGILARSYQSAKTSISLISSSQSSSSTSGFILSSSKDEQKMYSTISSSQSSENPIDQLKVRYRNIPQTTTSAPSAPSATSAPSYYSIQPQSSSNENGLPWVLLFSQSALWLLLAGKRMI